MQRWRKEAKRKGEENGVGAFIPVYTEKIGGQISEGSPLLLLSLLAVHNPAWLARKLPPFLPQSDFAAVIL